MDIDQKPKRKRGRPRKVLLPLEISTLIEETKLLLLDCIEVKKDPIKKQNGEWDVPIGTEIKFFDPTLSYEITGYKPINKDHGLDFNPEWFTEARENYKRTGHYVLFLFGSKAFSDFCELEYNRCRNGMTSHGYTITGDHYFFLNYYLLPNLHTAKAGSGRMIDFPDFYVALYEWFHYLELCKLLRKNAALMKARGLGFSEMNASLAANMYTVRNNSNTVIAANLLKYVEDTLSKVWNALSFLNDHTDDMFSLLSQVVNNAMSRRASYIEMRNGLKVEAGSMAQIKGIVADKPNKIRGDRTDLLLYEEGGSWINSTKAFVQGDALIHIQGELFGVKLIGGTGGDNGNALEGLRTIFYDPEAFNVLPYKHNYCQTGDYVLTGFFLPAFSIIRGEYMDSRGWTDPDKGKEYYNNLREKFAKSPRDLITYSAEYCFTPEEAFNLEGDNKFNKVNIAELLTRIRALKQCPPIETGFLEYAFKDGKHAEDSIIGFKWIPNLKGKILILEHPLWLLPDKKDEEGKVIWSAPKERLRNLYVIGVDGIDIGKSLTSENTKDPSDFCLTVFKRTYGTDEPQFVALYKDRPNDLREACKIAIKMALYYNAIINIEATRLYLISYARDKKLLRLFMKRPRATLSDSIRNTNKQYGTPATAAIIDHLTDLIADYVNDYCHLIWFESMLDELNRYTDENKGKFDIVASMAMSLIADEETRGMVPKAVEIVDNSFLPIGYYTDEYGHRRYGVLPDLSNLPIIGNNNFGIVYDDLRIRTSNPRLLYEYLS